VARWSDRKISSKPADQVLKTNQNKQKMKIEILKASRSWSNESEGKNMAGCLAYGERVACYFPTESAMEHAPLLAAAPELLAACKAARKSLEESKALLNSCGAALGMGLTFQQLETAIAKAERGVA